MRKLEICCYSTDDAIHAERGGADRIELCTGRSDGGLTPSMGLLIATQKKVNLPIYPIIRPRGGDFCYTQAELNTLKEDISVIRDLGFPGIVIGALTPTGDIDTAAITALVKQARGLSVTFHRAFDICRDPFTALKQLTDLGIDRILTSGQKPSAIDGLPLILALCEQSKGISIMPGAGIRSDNIEKFNYPKIEEFHSSASKFIPPGLCYRNAAVSMGRKNQDEYALFVTEINEVQALKTKIAAW